MAHIGPDTPPPPELELTCLDPTETKTRSARKATTEKRTKKGMILCAYSLAFFILFTDPDAEPKSKKAPSPYNLFVKAQLPIWKEANPGKSAKDAMSAVRTRVPEWRLYVSLTSCLQVSVLWKDSPENPKNAPGEKKESKAKKPTKAASKPSKKAAEEESPSSDSD